MDLLAMTKKESCKMKLYNTLTNTLEEFTPLEAGKVKMYVCGPTVYDRPHIGNARSVVVYDMLYRILMHIYGQDNVTYVRNITDVDDKINVRAKELSITIQELTSRIYSQFQSDMKYLGALNPTYEPKATEHISNIIEIIEILIKNGNAYVAKDHVYFDVTSDKNYGELSGRNLDDMIAGARIEVVEDKKHPGDFVLWKPASQKDDPSSVFKSPWSDGRPGWHIECSAMSRSFLGTDFDIHGGGADLIFPHHTNEIAQSTCAFKGSKYAKYWIHNGFLTVNGEKMSKSLGNFYTLGEFIDKGIKGEVMRYLLLSTHYRKPLDYNEKALYDAKETIEYLYRSLSGLNLEKVEAPSEFINHLKDDLNTSEAFAYLRELAKNINKTDDNAEKIKLGSALKACGSLLGFLNQNPKDFLSGNKDVDESYILERIARRKEAKANKDWALADQIRSELDTIGIELKDHQDGSTSWR
jgi:cysteinyl-tRNA synthetase